MDFLTLVAQIFSLVGEYLSQSILVQALAAEWKILSETHAILLLFVSAFCGALVGLEREYAHKPAGIRTNTMICVGSTLFTLASLYSWKYVGAGEFGDPGRIAAQIVSGVGFIGAGVILRTGLHITGITTASTIWLVAAVGMVVGMGFPLLGILAAVGAALTLLGLRKMDFHFPHEDGSPPTRSAD
jgi:putative Mg2+ transporter-C (MgtC) family protein